ncbi:uncharacterized protein LOC129240463 [Anastrepha obliqua]|uniref:uncharacterized protein LOC129240463 n=1 Tax=Anastrepha obliqua TaxID=95512 RepID=UPI002409C19F|nr:uncharacterized protein LOC129240463 [Anastrepha obliqua]XP_054732246.1 uncharacterized protein LOC129240463 [Anastrepha obliqua]XP_054732247.1 uncharacterized protein LOC129240463 [Anastrepha obliqua]XP_054732248.1 uncharacterized protein LOC129240463 [Anastrepha obliqua]
MVGRDITPTEIGKHSKLIKMAQEEMATMDVLVCGRCLNVYHFIEDFDEHKQRPCQKENNNVRECNDTKPKIWAFLLWKATQLSNNRDSSTASPNSWALYQTWVKMDESLRETWIVAGKTIQSFAKVGQGGLQEMPVKITKTVVNNTSESASPGRKLLTQTKPQVTNLKPPIKVTDGNKDVDNDPSHKGGTSAPKVVKKPFTIRSDAVGGVTQNKLPTGNAAKPLSRRAKRTVPNSDEVIEENVEKIVAKRFNPRRKMHEYLVKWESRTHEQNTWEPSSHLDNVPHLLETFETQLARQKETRAALQAKQAAQLANASKIGDSKSIDAAKKGETNVSTKLGTGIGKLQTVSSSNNDIGDSNKSTAGTDVSARPSRTSKTKAMDQVKQWVSGSNQVASGGASPTGSDAAGSGNNSQDGERDWSVNTSNSSANVGAAGLKRKLEDSDFNDSNTSDLPSTTATIEDLEEDLIPSHTVKRMKNGNAISIESKVVKVNGTSSTRTPASVSGESLPVGPNSAEIIITQDTNASGVVKKPGFNSNSRNTTPKSEALIRILSKGESAVSSTGIVRVAGGGSDSGSESKSAASTVTAGRTHIRVGAGGATTVGNTQINTISRQQHVQRTPGSTALQRKTIMTTGTTQQQRGGSSVHVRTGGITSSAQQHSSPTSGRMIIPRQGSAGHVTRPTASSTTKTVTPEQKILQLSKSGDLKVTKKVMTREDAIAQRMNLKQQQSQIQIQKVQQITPPTGGGRTSQVSAVSVRKQPDGTYAHEEQHQAQLCPITGKILGQDDQAMSQQQFQSGVIHTQLITGASGEQQLALQQDHQQQLQDIDPTLLLTSDQQMLTNEDGTPLLVTGEDGTVYQVAGKNAEGQTILVTQGPDGEQQFAYVAAAEGDDNQVLTLDNAVAEAVAQNSGELHQAESMAEPQYIVKTTKEDGTTHVVTMSEAELQQHQALTAAQQQQQADAGSGAVAVTASGGGATGQLCIQTSDGADGQEANIPAEVIQAGMPSPGGTRRVVLLLQDGTYMMTEMHDDEFKALNIAA